MHACIRTRKLRLTVVWAHRPIFCRCVCQIDLLSGLVLCLLLKLQHDKPVTEMYHVFPSLQDCIHHVIETFIPLHHDRFLAHMSHTLLLQICAVNPPQHPAYLFNLASCLIKHPVAKDVV